MRRRLLGILGALLLISITLVCLGAGQASPFTFLGYADADNVKVYASPSTPSSVVDVLRYGDVVKVIGTSDDSCFWEIRHKGKHGWVEAKHITPKT